MNRHALPLAVAAVALAASGCGSGDDSKKSSAGAPATTAGSTPNQPKPPQELLGIYTRSVTKADIERTQKKRSELGPNQEKPKPGPAAMGLGAQGLNMSFPKDPGYQIDQDYTATSDGRLAIRGYQHPESGSFCGPEIPQNATYTWKRAGNKLTLRAVGDPCADRDSTLTGTWTRK
jgi:hypothetical protein